ncbi:uncharacterized protein EHS24_009219 [Apiotrichum porosum]|uniref:Myb-like domain-containing protein n=1 Tax=Apiotrichum porosum TaxID=105984 RepID=A0A427XP77_9TREE|nr:uncharacterized protein EHS24_009219 [Apiotrichum porosum]RSH80635.1 hypothetical protein EHS24_009219 [Apiotrichum porosum]
MQAQPRRPWTAQEYELILSHVLQNGPGNFQGVVPGRSVDQIRMTWTRVVKPTIFKSLADKAGGHQT